MQGEEYFLNEDKLGERFPVGLKAWKISELIKYSAMQETLGEEKYTLCAFCLKNEA